MTPAERDEVRAAGQYLLAISARRSMWAAPPRWATVKPALTSSKRIDVIVDRSLTPHEARELAHALHAAADAAEEMSR